MHLTKFTDNSLRVLIYLATKPDGRHNITDIASACEIPRNHLTKVINQMAIKGLVETRRGKGGGVAMAHAPENLKVGDVVRAMEGTAEVVNCDNPKCPFTPGCRLRVILRDGQNAFLSSLDRQSIADLI